MTISPRKWKFGNFSEFSRGWFLVENLEAVLLQDFYHMIFIEKGACATCDKVIYFLTRWKEFRIVTRAGKFKTSKLTKFMKLVGRCMDETIRKNLYLFADLSFITGIFRNPTPKSRSDPRNWVILPLPLYFMPSGNRKNLLECLSFIWVAIELFHGVV